MLNQVPGISVDQIIERYPTLLLDAYGVLNSGSEALPGAVALIRRLREQAKPFYILTNDASRLPETSSARLRGMGLEIEAEQIISSGSLIASYFAHHQLAGAVTVVLGPEDSRQMVRDAGGEVVAVGQAPEIEAVVVCDEQGYPMLETIDALLSLLLRSIDQGVVPQMVLPNPDLIYPASGGRFGITAGSIALVLEAAIALRYPNRSELRFTRLGKPHAAIFEEAARRAGSGPMVMVGDQLDTDIRGANDFGIDSVLVLSGLTNAGATGSTLPTYILENLAGRKA